LLRVNLRASRSPLLHPGGGSSYLRASSFGVVIRLIVTGPRLDPASGVATEPAVATATAMAAINTDIRKDRSLGRAARWLALSAELRDDDDREREEERMVEEARLEELDSGLAPVTEGWFVVNVRDAAWLTNEAFGARCVFEAAGPVLRRRPDQPAQRFADVGFTLQVVQPGQASGMYHAETNQENFLVLAGECLLLVEGEERLLRAWDFVHCPPGTAHVFVGAGDSPCVIFMTGGRTREKNTVYQRSDLARRHGAGVETETSSPRDAYTPFPHWQPERPESWTGLPWA
jgi:uncharacterized cupin superfamily protein